MQFDALLLHDSMHHLLSSARYFRVSFPLACTEYWIHLQSVWLPAAVSVCCSGAPLSHEAYATLCLSMHHLWLCKVLLVVWFLFFPCVMCGAST